MPSSTNLGVTPEQITVAGVSKHFSGLTALDSIDLTVPRGEIVGLMGPNGSGKSTLVNVISGILRPDSGSVRVDGTDITGWNPLKVARIGVSRSFQNVRLFSDLTVRDNVAAVIRTSDAGTDNTVDDLLNHLHISEYASVRASSLAYGLQRRVEIARALATQPRYLLLDEPAAGLNDEETANLESIIREIARGSRFSCGVLIIDHDMRFISSLCQELHVLANGKTLAHGAPAEVRQSPAVIEAYLGKQDG